MRKLPRLMLLCICILATCLLVGCAGIGTQVIVDTTGDAFAGRRVMTVTVDCSGKGLTDEGVEYINAKIDEGIPNTMTYTFEKESGDILKYEFSLAFDSLEDYKKKVGDIIGHPAEVVYNPADNAFSSGFEYSENFSSSELMRWFDTIVQSEDAAGLDTIDITSYSPATFWKNGETELKLNGDTYTCATDKASFSITSDNDISRSVIFKTLISEDGAFTRSIEFKCTPAPSEELTAKMGEYFKTACPENGTLVSSSDASGVSFDLTFTATNETELAQITSKILGSDASCVITDEDSQPFISLTTMNEKLDFSYLCGYSEGVFFSYTLASDNGVPSGMTDADTLQDLAPMTNGNTMVYTQEKCTKVNFDIGFETIMSAVAVDYNLIVSGNDDFTREIKIIMAPGTEAAVLDQIKAYYDAKGARSTVITAFANDTDPCVQMVITGDAAHIVEAENVLFGPSDSRSLSYVRESGLFTLHPKTKLVDNFDISSLLSVTNVAQPIYTVVTEKDTLIEYTDENGTLPIDGNGACLLLSSGDGSVAFTGEYVNAVAIIFIVLISLLLLLLLALAVSIFMAGEEEEEEEPQKAIEPVPEIRAIPQPRDLTMELDPIEEEAPQREEIRQIIWYRDSAPPVEPEPEPEPEP
ncbi:MAG: hypothetical protein J6L81_09960, partial [Clostridia bacterium]|nr:hypothetical protein [Clostridia bacterium]